MAIPYEKIPLPLADLAKHLLIRHKLAGISQKDLEAVLARVGYFHLKGYFFVYRDRPTLQWEQVWGDYIFDEKLRAILFEAIAKIEIALRSQFDCAFSTAYGRHWYQNTTLFSSKNGERQFERNLQHLLDSWKRAQSDFKRHYEEKYDTAFPPPAWMIFESSTLGTLSKYFSSLDNRIKEKSQIARFFGVEKSSNIAFLRSWFAALSVLRNLCAHHSRVFSQIFITLPKIVPAKPFIKTRFYANLCHRVYAKTLRSRLRFFGKNSWTFFASYARATSKNGRSRELARNNLAFPRHHKSLKLTKILSSS